MANTSPATCGTSCTACTAPANATATCNGTSCGFTCDVGRCTNTATGACDRFTISQVVVDPLANSAIVSVDSTGVIHLGYRRFTSLNGYEFGYTRSVDGVVWSMPEFVASAASTFEVLAMDVNAQGTVGVLLRADQAFLYASRTATASGPFSVETIATAQLGASPLFGTLRFDTSGLPHVMLSTTTGFQYLKRTTTWGNGRSFAGPGSYTVGLAFEPGDVPSVCYWPGATSVSVAPTLWWSRLGAAPQTASIPTAVGVGASPGLCEMGIDVATSLPMVAFTDNSPAGVGSLKLARRTVSDTWATTTLRSLSGAANGLEFVPSSPPGIFWNSGAGSEFVELGAMPIVTPLPIPATSAVTRAAAASGRVVFTALQSGGPLLGRTCP